LMKVFLCFKRAQRQTNNSLYRSTCRRSQAMCRLRWFRPLRI
jgi:hypothetical protein